jgi:hypothetical protein
LTGTAASAGVLAASHGVAPDHSVFRSIKLAPQVWVSIFTTIANALLNYTFAEGLAIHFWWHAGRGATVNALRIANIPVSLPLFFNYIARGGCASH